MVSEFLQKGVGVNVTNYDHRTALHMAAGAGNENVVSWLIDNGADVNALARNQVTPLEEAVLRNRRQIVQLLRENGGIINPDRLPVFSKLLIEAAARGEVAYVSLLLDAGVDPNTTGYDDRTALHAAASEGRVGVVEVLVEHKANVQAVDRFGFTPLQECLRGQSRGHAACAKVLSELGATIPAKQEYGGVQLHASAERSLPHLCERGDFSFAELFLPTARTEDVMQMCAFIDPRMQSNSLVNDAQSRMISNYKPFLEALKTQKPVVISEVKDKELLANAVKQAGLSSAVIVPILHENGSHGLIVFYGKHVPPPSFDLSAFTLFTQRIVEAGFYGTSKTPVFAEREMPPNLQADIWRHIVEEGVFNPNLIYHEVDWFCGLGLQRYYFRRFSSKILSHHVHSYIAAKKLATANGDPEQIWFHIENNPDFLGGSGPEQVFIMCSNTEHKQAYAERLVERRIALVPAPQPYSFESFVSTGPSIAGGTKRLCIYILETAHYVNPNKVEATDDNIWDIASDVFLRDKSAQLRHRYQQTISRAVGRLEPTTMVFDPMPDSTIPVMIAFYQGSGSTTNYLPQMSELLRQNKLEPYRKFIETFSNGIIVYSLFLFPAPRTALDHFLSHFSLLYLIPKSELTPSFMRGEMSIEEYTYCSSATRFVYYFINQRSEEFIALSRGLSADPISLGRLRMLYTSMKRGSVSLNRILDVVKSYPSIVQMLVKDFVARTSAKWEGVPEENVQLTRLIDQLTSNNPMDSQIMTALAHFNRSVRRTNFFQLNKSSLAFRLDPKFLKFDVEWPTVPFGLYFIMGSDFQGFHMRFHDVARGGIRIIRSRDRISYNANLGSQFAETYGLAYTQNKKNKDIPEGGAKGTVLLNESDQGNSTLAFRKYIAGLLDLITPSDHVVDNLGKEELLFLGPDEGSAGMMEFAALYAKDRGYRHWRSFTTGKPQLLGGIPHDVFGMTTRSVHRYVLGCLAKLGLKESEVTKIQTGGPDGDLGSNEILLSLDKTKAIVDGSGVIYDPQGLDRPELVRLAKARQMIENFDSTKLGSGGFKVLISDQNVKLPDGELVESGLTFRNEFHLHRLAEADMFVPCGGRPESVTLSTAKRMMRTDGTPKFKIIVEGANLFFTNDARMVLEQKGVILYKDASTNKGGVTSSSLEVLAALAMDDTNFRQHMRVTDSNNPPEFYKAYVSEIQARVARDADLEFECIWREHLRTGEPRFRLTDIVSDKINDLADTIADSHLWDNVQLRKTILLQAIPKTLTDLLGLEAILQRVPEIYMRSVFSCYLASRYVYTMGDSANEFGFFEFMQPFFDKLRQQAKLQEVKVLTLEAEQEGEQAVTADIEKENIEEDVIDLPPPTEATATKKKAKKPKRSNKLMNLYEDILSRLPKKK